MTKINDFRNSLVAYLVCNPLNGLKLSFEIPQNNWFKSQKKEWLKNDNLSEILQA